MGPSKDFPLLCIFVASRACTLATQGGISHIHINNTGVNISCAVCIQDFENTQFIQRDQLSEIFNVVLYFISL